MCVCVCLCGTCISINTAQDAIHLFKQTNETSGGGGDCNSGTYTWDVFNRHILCAYVSMDKYVLIKIVLARRLIKTQQTCTKQKALYLACNLNGNSLLVYLSFTM